MRAEFFCAARGRKPTADALCWIAIVSVSVRGQYGCVFDRRLGNVRVVVAGGMTPLRRLFRACEKSDRVPCSVF